MPTLYFFMVTDENWLRFVERKCDNLSEGMSKEKQDGRRRIDPNRMFATL
jgi:hypothetical protein